MEKIKVLAVDDEFGIRSGITRILSKFEVDYPFMDDAIGFEVTEAETGEIAIELLQKEKYEIVLLDNKLPGIQGIEVLEYINANKIDSKVVMITSYASLDLAVKATREGAIDFVPKPFTPQELKASVENITKQLFLKRMAANLQREGRQIKFRFLSMLSHELKEPVDDVEKCLQKIKDREMGNNVSDYLPMLEKSSDRLKNMRAMINDLMALTKTENPLKEKNIKQVDLFLAASSCIRALLPEAEKKSIKLYLSGKSGTTVNADPNDIEIIYNNILSNLLRNSKMYGFIECKTSLNQDNPSIIFSDFGNPSDENLVKELNESLLSRNEQMLKTPGSELGLSIVNIILEDYHSVLKTENSELGTRFEVYFNNK